MVIFHVPLISAQKHKPAVKTKSAKSRRMPFTSAQVYSPALRLIVRRFALCLFVPGLLAGTILPEYVGTYKKVSTAPLTLDHPAVWNEYGLRASEQAVYELSGAKLHVEAYSMQDSTGALAAWQWKRPADSRAIEARLSDVKPSDAKLAQAKVQDLSKLTAVTPKGIAIALGNHFLLLDGYIPTADELANVFRSLPGQQSGPLPTLPDHLPAAGLVANSERYISGPASLALFSPEVSSTTAAFHLGSEAQLALFRTASGEEQRMEIFAFPTPDSARDRAGALGNTPNSIVKRTGPLVAVVFAPKDTNAAETLLSLVRFQAVITGQDRADHPPTKKDNWGNFMVNIFILIGMVLLFCLVSGAIFGGMRHLFRRGGESGDSDQMITLHLDNR